MYLMCIIYFCNAMMVIFHNVFLQYIFVRRRHFFIYNETDSVSKWNHLLFKNENSFGNLKKMYYLHY